MIRSVHSFQFDPLATIYCVLLDLFFFRRKSTWACPFRNPIMIAFGHDKSVFSLAISSVFFLIDCMRFFFIGQPVQITSFFRRKSATKEDFHKLTTNPLMVVIQTFFYRSYRCDDTHVFHIHVSHEDFT